MCDTHEKAKATRLLATHCCVCWRPLVDAKSVEMGIGPVCRKKYGHPDILTTDEMRMRALGALAVSGLDSHVIDEVLARGNDARQVCNWLVYWASANYTDKKIVLGCTPIIRLLGYTSLADKLEQDRSTVRLVVKADEIEVYFPWEDTTIQGLKMLNGVTLRDPKTNRFKCWAVPPETRDSLAILLGVAFGNEYCHVVKDGEPETYTIDAASWAAFTATLPKKDTGAQVHYRKNKRGEWVVFGPAHLVQPGMVTVTCKNGSRKTEVVESTGKPFDVNGVPHVYGYLVPKMENAGTASTPSYHSRWSY